ncbi:hypothetical protein BDN72DRAFT_840312, partial [Pluteus cervinus]
MIPTEGSQEIVEAIQGYPPNLRRLSAYVRGCHTFLDASRPTYQRLTHLDLIEAHKWEYWSTFLTQLPSLTHLALDHTRGLMISDVLRECRKVRALLFVSEDYSMEEVCVEDADDKKYMDVDERVVVVSIRALDNWLSGVRGEVDMWALADRVIMERRQKREKRLDAD